MIPHGTNDPPADLVGQWANRRTSICRPCCPSAGLVTLEQAEPIARDVYGIRELARRKGAA
jgi:hypothetical protein